MSTYLTSDQHFGHTRICELANRAFSSVEEMNEELISRYNSVVKPNDMVYFLGDVCMGKLDDNLPLLHRLNGTKLLILGNHDRPSMAYHHKTQEVRDKWTTRYNEFFPVMLESMNLGLLPNEEEVVLCHYPYYDPAFRDHEYDGRLEANLPIDEGKWLIHGHVHGAWRVNGKQINVGVDAWGGYPVSLDTILDITRNPKAYNKQGPYTIK